MINSTSLYVVIVGHLNKKEKTHDLYVFCIMMIISVDTEHL